MQWSCYILFRETGRVGASPPYVAPDSSKIAASGGSYPSYPSETASATVASVSPEITRRKIERVMADKETFLKSAKASFKQFDADNSGTLTFAEMRELVHRLCINLQLPPVDDDTLMTIFARYVDHMDAINLESFCTLYWQLLLRIRDKYYPTKKMRIRRALFVGRRNLTGSGLSITSLFKFIKHLGSGAFGEVHLVQEISSGLKRVIKTINKDKSAVPVENIEDEINVLKSLDHPNIIKIFEVYEDYNNIYIVMETCEGGELLERLVSAQQRGRALNEKYVSSIMSQLLSALAYFHSKNVVHKDLKPENVLFQDKSFDAQIKVIDFGLAELFDREEQTSRNAAGTALYMAPEVFKRKFNQKCDIWAAGVIMYFLLTGTVGWCPTFRRLSDQCDNRYTRDNSHSSGKRSTKSRIKFAIHNLLWHVTVAIYHKTPYDFLHQCWRSVLKSAPRPRRCSKIPGSSNPLQAQ
eukprot:GHVT01082739.1.p1 GENE.GHVT01082739.1~~GHVT01082739.1.p1  ORF type:complete len:468 (+),score=39.08 GHVT01082739.1:1565-2968(+)